MLNKTFVFTMLLIPFVVLLVASKFYSLQIFT